VRVSSALDRYADKSTMAFNIESSQEFTDQKRKSNIVSRSINARSKINMLTKDISTIFQSVQPSKVDLMVPTARETFFNKRVYEVKAG